jgi:hypothetical protein
VMRSHSIVEDGSIENLFSADRWARQQANAYCGG